jgi:hypothetical protein
MLPSRYFPERLHTNNQINFVFTQFVARKNQCLSLFLKPDSKNLALFPSNVIQILVLFAQSTTVIFFFPSCRHHRWDPLLDFFERC